MFSTFFSFEIKNWLRAPMPWIFMFVFGLLAFGAIVSDNVSIGGRFFDENFSRRKPRKRRLQPTERPASPRKRKNWGFFGLLKFRPRLAVSRRLADICLGFLPNFQHQHVDAYHGEKARLCNPFRVQPSLPNVKSRRNLF